MMKTYSVGSSRESGDALLRLPDVNLLHFPCTLPKCVSENIKLAATFANFSATTCHLMTKIGDGEQEETTNRLKVCQLIMIEIGTL
jgi:hypothetical protein